ncbi:hypothetical protein N7507_003393 [Penicillium longicatenatum]|nr:hypothetical protein N7507_003393 [Penicillium longicatenatum]
MDYEERAVGPIRYVRKTKSWSFPSVNPAMPSLLYTGVTKTVIPSTSKMVIASKSVISSPPYTANPKLFSTHGRPPKKEIKSILKQYPDLYLVRFPWLLREPLESSTASNYNFPPSALLDLGYAAVSPQDSSHISIAATVAGEDRNVISLRMILEDTLKLPLVESTVLVPAISDEEATEWSIPGARIQQICFSQPPESERQGTWMAARLLYSTVIFRPLYRRAPTAPINLYNGNLTTNPASLRTSRLDANPLVEIPITWTGGHPHADVAFHPSHQNTLAIIDIRGNWSIWEVQTNNKGGKPNAVIPGPRGSISTLDQIDTDNDKPADWASIQWVLDSSTILVADRRSAMLFHLEGIEPRAIQLKLGTHPVVMEGPERKSQPEWVLDVKRSPQNTAQFCILTSARLLLFDITTAPWDQEDRHEPLEASLVRHLHRDTYNFDTTLRLSDLLIGDYLYLVVYSRASEVVEVFPCPYASDRRTEGFFGSGFFLNFQPPLDPSSIGDVPSNTSLRYSTFVFKEVNHSPAHGSAHSDITLVKLFWMDPSFAVHETLFKGPPHRSLRKRMGIENHVNHYILRASKRPFERVGDDFVVDDWHEPVMPPHNKARTTRTTQTMVRTQARTSARSTNHQTTYEGLRWTLNLSLLYKRCLKGVAGCFAQAKLERSRPTIDQIIRDLDSVTVGDAKHRQHCRSLFQISGRPVSNDIEESVHDTKRLVSTILPDNPDLKPQHQFLILSRRFCNVFPAMSVASREKKSGLDFLEIYDQLVHQWLTNLPNDIPHSTRRMKEKIIRGVALDVFLARIIQIPNESKVVNPQKDGLSNDTPVQAGPASSQLLSSQNTEFESRSSQPEPEDEKAPATAFSSLSEFITFRKPRPLPRNVVNVLSHWQVGTDPSTYNWTQVSQGQEGLPHRRVRKKRSRQIQLSQTPVATPSVSRIPSTPQIRTWGSQPEGFPASSQPSISDKFMTQTERGQFGARKVKSNKKRKRAEGF